MIPSITALVVAYLLGSIPFGYVLVRTFRKEDIRATGSGNIGATNVAPLRRQRPRPCHALARPAQRLRRPWSSLSIWPCAPASPTPSSSWRSRLLSLWLPTSTPSGSASKAAKAWPPLLASFIPLVPAAAGCILLIFILLFAVTRIVSLASIIAAASLMFLGPYFAHGPLSHLSLLCLIFIPLLVIAKHHQNIRRLLSGTEHSFSKKKEAA